MIWRENLQETLSSSEGFLTTRGYTTDETSLKALARQYSSGANVMDTAHARFIVSARRAFYYCDSGDVDNALEQYMWSQVSLNIIRLLIFDPDLIALPP